MNRDDLRAVTELATRAPSIHNSQPWRFGLDGEALTVRADRDRQLPVLDPDGRQLHVSWGAAVEHAWLAVRSLGRECTVRLLPDADDEDLLARLESGVERALSDDERALIEAIPRRHTHREAFEPRPLPPELVDVLRRGVVPFDAWLQPVERADDLVKVAVLLSHADEAERADPAYHEELRQWVRPDGEPAVDGIPSTALPATPIAKRRSTLLLRDFDLDRVLTGTASADEVVPVTERPFVAVLGTVDDDRRAWLQAGRALAWLLLRGAVEGVFASPLNQVLDLAGTRARFARDLGLLGHPQMLLRMGFASGAPATPRRAVDEVIG